MIQLINTVQITQSIIVPTRGILTDYPHTP